MRLDNGYVRKTFGDADAVPERGSKRFMSITRDEEGVVVRHTSSAYAWTQLAGEPTLTRTLTLTLTLNTNPNPNPNPDPNPNPNPNPNPKPITLTPTPTLALALALALTRRAGGRVHLALGP